jgi:hypothetical protein
LKGQFKDGESFYSTLLHEMAHSTGTESRLNRDLMNTFQSAGYAKEELVAELTAAVTCQSLGIVSSLRAENAQYLKSWLRSLNEEPKFILSVLTNVSKAMNMIHGVVQHQTISEALTAEKNTNDLAGQSKPFLLEEFPAKDFKSIGIHPEKISPEDMKKLLNGELTNVMRPEIRDPKNAMKKYTIEARMRLHRNVNNTVSLLLFPAKNEIKQDLNHQKTTAFKR